MNMPKILYHGSSFINRDSILEHGLLRSRSEVSEMARDDGESEETIVEVGSLFFSTKPAVERDDVDIWVVDADGLVLELDDTTDLPDPEDIWYRLWDDVAPERLSLLEQDLRPSMKL